jgi:hypothetical protein
VVLIMGSNPRRTLSTEQTANALRTSEVVPAANDAAMGRPADLSRAEVDFDPVRGISMGVLIGAIMWAVIGALVWLSLR